MLFVGYKKCSTSNKAQAWLDAQGIAYTFRDIKGDNPNLEELALWHKQSGQPLKRLFNTSGMLYRELQLKDRLPQMSEQEQLQLLASNGMLVKRPIAVAAGFVMFGFKEDVWEKALKK